ncbi:MAG: hypothetical protein GW762_03930 [Candidatus Pacebacteria bacterium]|nr:hypothetical protein [Candidatus Paceibacterota bacterium]PIR63351.1 MAG: hypothetical protein COU64_05220 [Candidatus Pacebacteria bacterium CG10_big_fil_rev_8_21_14_0_10_40_26]PIZ79003.1 MAG: hypothetical protein COY01_01070 [Candidatus Pacebacteria bacterium CG_4_10_14_0_2_um_filter_40_20]PJA68551.1 MAG: hypothetical protein CO156_04950 [Candidatus Pacebacteria bacterium CG_4_9_14_3_um_filter_40_12]PJC41935.1 MAG: hypothetical protein CO041_02200 [Candidatus Pacebacteria bacterium CG_4_9_
MSETELNEVIAQSRSTEIKVIKTAIEKRKNLYIFGESRSGKTAITRYCKEKNIGNTPSSRITLEQLIHSNPNEMAYDLMEYVTFEITDNLDTADADALITEFESLENDTARQEFMANKLVTENTVLYVDEIGWAYKFDYELNGEERNHLQDLMNATKDHITWIGVGIASPNSDQFDKRITGFEHSLPISPWKTVTS